MSVMNNVDDRRAPKQKAPRTNSDVSTWRAHIEDMVTVGSWTAPDLIGSNH